MTDIDRLRSIEWLTQPNEVEPVEVPILEMIDADYQAAHEKARELSSRLTMDVYLETQVENQCLRRLLMEALRSRALSQADHRNCEDIITQWRAYNGFTMDKHGEIHYAPVPMN